MNNSESSDPLQLNSLLRSRATELFKLCDVEEKGFINKKDIQRMREPLGLTPDLVEEVFDSLDTDKNGYLTLDEFSAGFSAYLGAHWDNDSNQDENNFSHNISSGYGSEAATEEDMENEILFRETMDSLGAANIIEG